MVCAVNKIDSNVTGLRIAEEECLKELPGVGGVDAVWHPLEPNGYSDFGASITTTARNPINPSRQRKKGSVTDLDASGGISQDMTQTNLTRMMQGFLFADAREKSTSTPMNAAAIPASSIATDVLTFSANLPVAPKAGDLVLLVGFGLGANNGLKLATAADADSITVTGLADEVAPPATATAKVVGHQFADSDVAITYTPGNLPRLTSAAFDLTTLGLIPGEFIFVGGDDAATSFAVGTGFARVSAIAAGYLELDKIDWAPAAESGAGKTIRIFTADIIRNEKSPALIKRRSYQIERTLGDDVAGPQSEVLIGAVPNELTINVEQAAMVTADLTFVACDDEYRTGTDGLKPGTRPNLIESDAFNTTSDFSRIKLASVSSTDANPAPIFAFASTLTLTVNNNVTPTKAIGTLGSFDTNVGTFEVGGSIEAYFADMQGPKAVRNNADITLDFVAVKNNAGVLFDIPLLSLGDGRLNVEQDTPIMLTLENMAAESKFGHTLMFQTFDYLPNSAE